MPIFFSSTSSVVCQLYVSVTWLSSSSSSSSVGCNPEHTPAWSFARPVEMCLDIGLGRLSSPSQLLPFWVEFVNFCFFFVFPCRNKPLVLSCWDLWLGTLHAVLLILAWFFISLIFSFVSTNSSVIVYACVYTMCCMHYKIKECVPDGDVATDCNVFMQQWCIGCTLWCYSSLHTLVLWK